MSWNTLAPALAAADFAVLFFAAVLVQYTYDVLVLGIPDARNGILFSATLPATLFVAVSAMQGAYRYESILPNSRPIERAAGIWCLCLLVLFATLFISNTGGYYARGALVLLVLVGIGLLAVVRSVGLFLLVRLTEAAAVSSRRTMLVGERQRIEEFLATEHPAALGIAITGRFNLSPDGDDRLARELDRVVLAARRVRPDDIMLVMPWSDTGAISACTNRLMELPVGIRLAPEALFRMFPRVRTAHIGEMTSLTLVDQPLSRLGVYLKRTIDIALSAAGLIIVAPLLLLIAAAIRLESRGPVFFLQRRYGFNRREFSVIKFRSMHVGRAGDGFRQATLNDDRVTRVGRFLRRTNLDELPQLLNVLGGTMSLVGPRPHPVELDEAFFRRISLYARRHNMKPGMTGWAQVNGFRGETTADVQMRARIVYDLYYLDNWSIGFDLMILFLTAFSRKTFRNAY